MKTLSIFAITLTLAASAHAKGWKKALNKVVSAPVHVVTALPKAAIEVVAKPVVAVTKGVDEQLKEADDKINKYIKRFQFGKAAEEKKDPTYREKEDAYYKDLDRMLEGKGKGGSNSGDSGSSPSPSPSPSHGLKN